MPGPLWWALAWCLPVIEENSCPHSPVQLVYQFLKMFDWENDLCDPRQFVYHNRLTHCTYLVYTREKILNFVSFFFIIFLIIFFCITISLGPGILFCCATKLAWNLDLYFYLLSPYLWTNGSPLFVILTLCPMKVTIMFTKIIEHKLTLRACGSAKGKVNRTSKLTSFGAQT